MSAGRRQSLSLGFSQAPPEWTYIVRIRLLPAAAVDDFRTWYDEHHLPRILALPGFHWASRYESAGRHFITMYAVDGPAVFESKEYLSLPGWEHWRPFITDWTRSLYRLSDNLGHRGRD